MTSQVTTQSHVLANLPVFQQLSPTAIQELSSLLKQSTFKRQSYIYENGQPSDKVYFLTRGNVKIGSFSNDGREIIKQIIHPMAMFGELSLLGEENRKDFAMTMNETVTLYYMEIRDFRLFMQRHPILATNFIMQIGERLRRTEVRLESMIFKDARQRIIDFLKEQAKKRGKRIGFEMLIRHSLTQQDIANITGTSRQTVTSVLNELRKSNLIHFNRRSILIRDLTRLA